MSAGGQVPAARTSILGGTIRPGELVNGIHHALWFAVVTGILNGKNGAGPGGRCYVWPAAACDGDGAAYSASGPLYMGGLIAIPSSVNLAAHTFNTVQGKNFAYALQQYGAYIVDTAGGFMNANVDHAVPASDMPAQGVPGNGWDLDQHWIVTQLAVVTNSYHAGTGGQVQTGYKIDGGDGTVNAALIAPPFATQYGGGNGRSSYFVPHWPRSLWAWITRGFLQ
jgi:hypothetical protein